MHEHHPDDLLIVLGYNLVETLIGPTLLKLQLAQEVFSQLLELILKSTLNGSFFVQ